jgi:SpoVK/Ycf46/Vps4 family AAA+-type ATPase
MEVHKNVMDSLMFKKSGLYLFNGPPGTGKSSYIKHLLSEKLDRKLAYIPVSMTGQLVSPDLVPLLMDNKDIILVIEDAEKALLSRETSENAAIVSTILNLTDGFIGDAMNVSIIATFNTDKEKIDAALLRKGRLRVSYEFKLLSAEDARKLAKSIGKDPAVITEPMALADIYNLDADTGYKAPEERKVGFR